MKFLLDHCEPMVSDDAQMFKRTVCTIMDPIVNESKRNSTRSKDKEVSGSQFGDEASVASLIATSQHRMTCNGSGDDNQPSTAGVAGAVKPGSGHLRSISAGNMITCNGRLHLVGELAPDENTDAFDLEGVKRDFPLTIDSVFSENCKYS